MCERWEGLGVTSEQLREGVTVMVPTGMGSAVVNGGPCVIALATVIGPARPQDDQIFKTDTFEMWWLNVHLAGTTMPQMYRVDQILGIPTPGLAMTEPPPVRTWEPPANGAGNA